MIRLRLTLRRDKSEKCEERILILMLRYEE